MTSLRLIFLLGLLAGSVHAAAWSVQGDATMARIAGSPDNLAGEVVLDVPPGKGPAGLRFGPIPVAPGTRSINLQGEAVAQIPDKSELRLGILFSRDAAFPDSPAAVVARRDHVFLGNVSDGVGLNLSPPRGHDFSKPLFLHVEITSVKLDRKGNAAGNGSGRLAIRGLEMMTSQLAASASSDAKKRAYLRFAARDLLAVPDGSPNANSFKLQGLLASLVEVKDPKDPRLARFFRDASRYTADLTRNNHRPGPFEIFFPIASYTAAKAMLGPVFTGHPDYPAYRDLLLRHQSSWPDYKSNSSQIDGRPVADAPDYGSVPSNIGNGNFRLLVVTAGLLSAQEFPELRLVSIDPKSRKERVRARDEVLKDMRLYARGMLSSILHHNLDEYGSPIYLAIDYAPIHMLAEYAEDPEIRTLAGHALDWMYSSLATSWNQGHLISPASRSKGDFLGTRSALGFLGWLHFDTRGGTHGTVTNFNVYPALPGKYQLPPAIRPHDAFPYVKREAIGHSRHVHLYAFQSKSFGLVNAMESRAPSGRLTNKKWDTDSFFKEAARNKLNWLGKIPGGFSPQWENSRQAYGSRRNQANARYYGTNPWSMVLQNRGTQIGLADVPPTYPFRKLYATYEDHGPIQLRVQNPDTGWTLCHTGRVVFGFRSLKPPTKTNEGKEGGARTDSFDYKKTAWILEVVEAPPQPADKSPEVMKSELDAFHRTLLTAKTEATHLDDADPALPTLSYFSPITGKSMKLDFADYPIVTDGEGMLLKDYPVMGTYPDNPSSHRLLLQKDQLFWLGSDGKPTLARDFRPFPPP